MIGGGGFLLDAENYFVTFSKPRIFFPASLGPKFFFARVLKHVYRRLSQNIFVVLGTGRDFFRSKTQAENFLL